MYSIRFKVGVNWYERTGFSSLDDAEDFRLSHTTAHIWKFYKDGKEIH